MVKMKIRMLSVSQSMANRKTFQQFALINSEIVSFMDYSDGLVLKVHFLVMLGFSLTNCILQALLIPEANIVITSRTRARTRTYHVHN